MIKNEYKFLVVFIFGILLLFPSYYQNTWNAIPDEDFHGWRIAFDRSVIARLVKSRQDGIFSASGLLGLGDSGEKWAFGAESDAHQLNTYLNYGKFNEYLVYKSHPGFQGTTFSFLDLITSTSPATNLNIYHALIAFLSASMIAFLSAMIAIEFGWLSGIFILLFSAFAEWMILPSGSLYWNLWSFYVPFVTCLVMLARSMKTKKYEEGRIHWAIFIAILVKILYTGFELITTVLIMTTVPLVFHAIYNRWDLNTFANRIIKVGVVSLIATLAGLTILSVQIALNDGNFSSAYEYISQTLDRRATGNPENYTAEYADSMRVGVLVVIKQYLVARAFTVYLFKSSFSVVYWQIFLIFALFTFILLARHWSRLFSIPLRRDLALVITTWFSILAPLSWYIIFKPTSYIHTFIFPMAWQMPFTLLGFALCGYVITDLFKRNTT